MSVGRLAVAGAIGVGLSNIPIIKEPAVALGKNAAEVAVMMSTNISATVEDIYWVDLPQSPIFEAGYHEDGSFDPEMLFERWYSAGIDLEDFELFVELGKISAPTIMGTKDPKMVQGMVEDAQKVNAFIEERYPRAVALLSDPDWIEQHQHVDLVEPVRNYLDNLVMTLYQDMEMDEVSGPGKYVDIQGEAHARELAQEAMRETGLRSLRFSSLVARDPWYMGNAAEKLIELNEKLRRKTGWEGAVLGLGGRVDWSLSRPSEMVNGTTKYLLKKEPGHSQLLISSGFGAAPHEFWHALEVVAGRKSLVSHTGRTILSQFDDIRIQVWDENGSHEIDKEERQMLVKNHHDTVLSIIDGYQEIVSSTPEWMELRELAETDPDIGGTGYFLRAEEVMASAFTSQIYKWDISSPGEPSMYEAEEHEEVFEAVFRAADSMELTKRANPSLINVSSWGKVADLLRPSVAITGETLEQRQSGKPSGI